VCGDKSKNWWVTGGFRWIPLKSDNGKFTTSLEARWGRFAVGVDYRPLTKNLGPIASALLVKDESWHPAVVVGTGPDQFGSVRSQCYFGTLSKSFKAPSDISVSPFLGAGYIEAFDTTELIRGVIVRRKGTSAQFFNNGLATHLVLSQDVFKHHTFSFVLWGMEDPGCSYTFRF
jgi:hypothetical protein